MGSTHAKSSKGRFFLPTVPEEEPGVHVCSPDCLVVLMVLSSLFYESMYVATFRSANRSIRRICFRHKVLVNSIAFDR